MSSAARAVMRIEPVSCWPGVNVRELREYRELHFLACRDKRSNTPAGIRGCRAGAGFCLRHRRAHADALPRPEETA